MDNFENYKWELTIEHIRRRIPEAKRILKRAVMLHVGWEMDNEICAVELNDGYKLIVGTSHGGLIEIEAEKLEQFIKNYETAITQSRAVLDAILNEQTWEGE